MIDVQYDLDQVVLHESDSALERFVDLLPLENPERLLSQTMPCTPCVHARTLGRQLGLPRLYLKDETCLPTSTTKYRMAVVSLAFLDECGVREFCTSSTGNSSTAYAHASRGYSKCRIYLFTGEEFAQRLDCPATDQVVVFLLEDATFVEAFDCAGAFAARRKFTAERGFFNPGRREGLKLAFLEAADQIPCDIDWYVQAVSSAMGVYGAFKGAKELFGLKHISRLPRLLCVQQETCAPMVRAWEEEVSEIAPRHIVERPTGIAKAILRGNPSRAYRVMHPLVTESRGGFVAVSEQEIREARRMVEELEGLTPCFSASTALAGLIRKVRRGEFPTHDCVLVNLTGGDRPAVQNPPRMHRLKRTGEGWGPADANDDQTRRLWEGPAPEDTAS